jgi:poly-gamma-glutamate capsule biosynthesis protein CapA/YwtB (metallophosphatase superfamily)
MVMISKRDCLLHAAVCFGTVFSMAATAWAQSPMLNLSLTGQSLNPWDIRTSAPVAAPTIASLLKGDVVFTNFEAAVFDVRKGQSAKDGEALSPPEALESLKTFGFNLLSLSNNHSWDLKAAGIENTLEQVKRLDLVHAGIGHTVEEAVAPGYLHTPKGTVALVAMASGLIAEGGSATATRPGVNELRVEGKAPFYRQGLKEPSHPVAVTRSPCP